MPEVTPDFKEGKRKKASRKEWKSLHSSKTGPCRICSEQPTSLHHLVPRSLGGDDVEANLVPLCGSGTTGCHGYVERRDKHVCGMLRAMLKPAEENYIVEKQGAHYLNKRYPLLLDRPTDASLSSSRAGGSVEQDATDGGSARPAPSPSSPREPGGAGSPVPPGSTCPTCARVVPPKRKKLPGRYRVTFAVKVPKDVQENGHEVLTTLVDSARDELRESMGWSETVPPYYVLAAVLHDWLGARQVAA